MAESFFFLVKLQALGLKKRDSAEQVFSCEFCEISKNTFVTEQLWTTASVNLSYMKLTINTFLMHEEQVKRSEFNLKTRTLT